MQKFDLHIVSIPDHRTQVAIANLIASANRTISMQTAMDMVRNPPIMLGRNLDMTEAEKYKDKLNQLGVGFRFEPVDASDPLPDGGLNDFAGIKAHNENVDKGDAPPANKAPAPKPAASGAPPAHVPNYGGGGRSGGGAHRQTASGLRVGDVAGLEALRAQERKAKKVSVLFSLACLVIILTLFLITRGGGGGEKKNLPSKEQAKALQEGKLKQQEQQEQQKQAQGAAAGQQRAEPAPNAQAGTRRPMQPQPANSDNMRSRVSSQQKQEADNYVDSARAVVAVNTAANAPQKSPSTGSGDAIRFYRIAISFNRYNLTAWQGLLQAYRDNGMAKETRETEEQMRAIFGDKVNTVSNTVKPFGELLDTYTSENGNYRVEYKSQKRTRTDILNEVFAMTRSVRAACACENISIFATTGPGRGMLVHSSSSTPVNTLSAFQSQAEILWLD